MLVHQTAEVRFALSPIRLNRMTEVCSYTWFQEQLSVKCSIFPGCLEICLIPLVLMARTNKKDPVA